MELDFIFSVGPACRPAYYLKTNYLRAFACPLDWQMDYSLKTCLHLFQTGFQTFFVEIEENLQRKGAHNNRRIIDTRNSITSIHHFDSSVPLSEALLKFHAVMQKRYLQLHTAILESENIGLICNREDSINCLSEFLSAFGQIYPNVNFTLINIRNVKKLNSMCVDEYILSPKLTIKEYSFHDEYLGDEYKEDRQWLGNTNFWNNLLKDYYIARHPFAEYVKKAVACKKFIHIYGAGVYSQKIIHFLKKYEVEISDIIVTSMENNPSSIEKISVLPYNLIAENYHDDLIIISIINQKEASKIYNLLKANGFKSIIRTDSLLRVIL